jgi:hypothetical protein
LLSSSMSLKFISGRFSFKVFKSCSEVYLRLSRKILKSIENKKFNDITWGCDFFSFNVERSVFCEVLSRHIQIVSISPGPSNYVLFPEFWFQVA